MKKWFMETRPQFLILSVVLAFLGICLAWFDGYFNLGRALLAGFGLVLTHVSVNTLNDYFDYKSGIDKNTVITPFSGGSGMLPAGHLKPIQVLWLGTVSFIIAAAIGVYFIITTGWQLLPLLIVAGLCMVLYSPLILKTPSPEWAAGLGLGTLPILGMYYIQTGSFTIHAVLASIPSGILVYNLLLLNEFPDVEADKVGRRRTLPITAGVQKAGIVYSIMMLVMYVWIVGMAILMPGHVFILLGLLTLPFAIKAIRGVLRTTEASQFVPYMANNVIVVLATQFLLGVGFILGNLL